MGLSWELGRWPIGHRPPPGLAPPSKFSRSAPLCLPRPGPCASLPDSPRSAQQGSHRVPGLCASGLRFPPVLRHTSPLSSAVLRGRLSTLFSGLISFRIKAKPSPGCEYNAPRASRGEERGAETSRGQQRGVAGRGGWWDVTGCSRCPSWGARPSRPETTSPHCAAGPNRGCQEGEGALSLGVERGAYLPLRSAVRPGRQEGRQRPDPACLALLGARREVGKRSWIR